MGATHRTPAGEPIARRRWFRNRSPPADLPCLNPLCEGPADTSDAGSAEASSPGTKVPLFRVAGGHRVARHARDAARRLGPLGPVEDVRAARRSNHGDQPPRFLRQSLHLTSRPQRASGPTAPHVVGDRPDRRGNGRLLRHRRVRLRPGRCGDPVGRVRGRDRVGHGDRGVGLHRLVLTSGRPRGLAAEPDRPDSPTPRGPVWRRSECRHGRSGVPRRRAGGEERGRRGSTR